MNRPSLRTWGGVPARPGGARSPARPSGGAGAFTLVELLVVVGVIALLIGILVPVLGAARNSAKDGVCLANLKTLGSAWHAYLADTDHFPWTDPMTPPEPWDDPPWSWGWGGLDNVRETQAWHVFNTRPLNPYLQIEVQSRRFVDVFRCPRDNGGVTAHTGVSLANDPTNFNFIDRSELDTWFGRFGNSYTSNDWVWANVGSADGAGPAIYDPAVPWELRRHWNHRNSLSTIVQPAKTAMIGDYGGLEQGPCTDAQNVQRDIFIGWWHGVRVSNVAFWDGSARLTPVQPGGATADYWMWLQPDQHPPGGTPMARLPWLQSPAAH